MFNPNHSYTNNETNLQILHTLPKGPKLNITEQYEIHNQASNILNDQLHYKTHTLFGTITHASHTKTSAIPTHHSQFYRDHQAHGVYFVPSSVQIFILKEFKDFPRQVKSKVRPVFWGFSSAI